MAMAEAPAIADLSPAEQEAGARFVMMGLIQVLGEPNFPGKKIRSLMRRAGARLNQGLIEFSEGGQSFCTNAEEGIVLHVPLDLVSLPELAQDGSNNYWSVYCQVEAFIGAISLFVDQSQDFAASRKQELEAAAVTGLLNRIAAIRQI